MPDRIRCVVPFCRRSTGKRCREWICSDHWRPIRPEVKRLLSRARRRRDWDSFDRTWRWVKRMAIEIAAGVSK